MNKYENQPETKKMKRTPQNKESNEDPDDSMKFFKPTKPKTAKTTGPSSSNVATDFIDESSKKKSQPTKTKAKTTSKTSKRKPKAHVDIRKVFGKQEEMFNHVVAENCLQEGIDPDEMQLALAISESLKDNNVVQNPNEPSTSKFENPFTSLGKVKPISAALERFGFKCKKTYSEYELDLISNTKLSKRSKFQKCPTALTRTSKEKREKVISLKIDRVLGQNTTSELSKGESSSNEYKVFSYFLQELEEKSRTVFKINAEDRPTDSILLDYYITELFEPSFCRADHLLKDWNMIPGRDRSPCRDVQVPEKCQPLSIPTELNEVKQSDFEDCREKSLEEGALIVCSTSLKKENSLLKDTSNIEEDSCVDLFEGLEDHDEDQVLISSEETENVSKDDSEKLGTQLEVLQEKLSQSMVLVGNKENNSLDSDATIENVDYLSKSLSKELVAETIIDLLSEPESLEEEEEYSVDLTQQDESRIQRYLKKVDSGTLQESKPTSTTTELTQSISQNEEKQQVSFTQVDLVSTDEDIVETQQDKIDSEECFLNMTEVPSMCSQSSVEDENEVINISDEEVNYSMKKIHQNYETEEVDENSIDLTQTEDDYEKYDQFEINNIVDQSLVDIMQQEDLNINSTISSLVEASVLNTSSQTKKAATSDGLSESIREIMNRYCVKIDDNEKPRSFRKMQSDSTLINNSVKRRKTAEFSFENDGNVVDLTQKFENEYVEMKENLVFNNSIHLSMENIVDYSPESLQQNQRTVKSQKKSLGVDIDKDYLVDTETVAPEPDYKNMTPVELKQTLFKYGIRPLPVKKAISLLEYIYDQLHPKIRVAAEEEIDVNDSRRDMNITDIATNIGAQEHDNFVFQLGLVEGEEYVLPKMRKSKVKRGTIITAFQII